MEEMDEALITNWNEMIGRRDLVYIVGDFAWKHKFIRVTVDKMLKSCCKECLRVRVSRMIIKLCAAGTLHHFPHIHNAHF